MTSHTKKGKSDNEQAGGKSEIKPLQSNSTVSDLSGNLSKGVKELVKQRAEKMD